MSRKPYKTRAKKEFRQDETDAAAAEQAEIKRIIKMSTQAAEPAAPEPPAALTAAKRGPGRPRKPRNPVGRPRKQMPTVQEKDAQGAKGAGFLSKYRNKLNKRVVKLSNVEKMKNPLRLVAFQEKAGNDNPKIVLELNELYENYTIFQRPI